MFFVFSSDQTHGNGIKIESSLFNYIYYVDCGLSNLLVSLHALRNLRTLLGFVKVFAIALQVIGSGVEVS